METRKNVQKEKSGKNAKVWVWECGGEQMLFVCEKAPKHAKMAKLQAWGKRGKYYCGWKIK